MYCLCLCAQWRSKREQVGKRAPGRGLGDALTLYYAKFRPNYMPKKCVIFAKEL